MMVYKTGETNLSSMSKAWAGALMAGLTSLVSMVAIVDFSVPLAANTIRDMVVATTLSILAGFGGVWVSPKNVPTPELKTIAKPAKS